MREREKERGAGRERERAKKNNVVLSIIFPIPDTISHLTRPLTKKDIETFQTLRFVTV